uniref:Membrin n=1 Tax=Hemiselmis tepida TaxID=464990 RepID=A0A7S0VN98_9CRYP|mmetsp:Transcript_20379/g.51452  ORF Transcript_20379/g.51452 Transcript_20379/m.51452 type:complete len:220 (+) Transcript_20379:139-798(+)
MSLSLEDQHRNARKVCMEAENLLVQAASPASAPEAQSEAVAGARTALDQAKGLLANMDSLVAAESANKREMWRAKVQNLREELRSLGVAFDKEARRIGSKEQEVADRAALFAGRGGVTGVAAAPTAEDVENNISLRRSTAAVDDLEARGMHMLGSLSGQKEMLKGAHKKVLDVMNTLGVSNSLIRVIERRQTMDLVWMLLGMIATVVILAVTWIYFRRK